MGGGGGGGGGGGAPDPAVPLIFHDNAVPELLSPLSRMPFPFSMAVFTLETDDTRDGKTDG